MEGGGAGAVGVGLKASSLASRTDAGQTIYGGGPPMT